MKVAAFTTVLAAAIGTGFSAPAIVWTNNKDVQNTVQHSSEAIKARTLLSSAVSSEETSLDAVVFLLGRDQDGSASLNRLTASGALPNIGQKYNDADVVHHHVDGVESSYTMARDAKNHINGQRNVMEVNLSEFNSKMTSLKESAHSEEVEVNGKISKKAKEARKRSRALAAADVLVVSVSPDSDMSLFDSAVTSAIDHASIDNVILTSVRSVDEVKLERKKIAHRKLSFAPVGRRRLANDDGETPTYYVNMTPNIFAGLLYFFFFAWLAYLGISCMGMIQGQDVYVKKYPTIGREA
uniref:Protein BIG1 n=1 Tax=Helicotheca tamesis TaxID=374047 RepID=A0A7S2HLL0_9STRA|mmetsp:Transcript_19121/g.26313  ORF Transcript_19121/g.26313 Transcript_19121/m.26313 type:complete len:297 (+) Transcript_19121:77-967(+)|eukprot:CAMPEP_0185732458 /NCGR_PEP_ID=MMETSP1171-20130828/16263_1 /TAXON_ID=374046 /ORGANISM="Helicotheca tamensis, Strain CCMP826" /LENGTH=296 /DNA_ID=CAMNT_0028401955 /DNA_START=68 /DNA_END=958 /DNA_ORIENTATION=+